MSNRTKHIARSEIFIGIVGPTGSDHRAVIEILASELESRSHTIVRVRLSELLDAVEPKTSISTDIHEYKRIKSRMDQGSCLRNKMKRGDALAMLAIAKIDEERSKFIEEETPIAYILDSLKHPQEIKTLRSVYGDSFSVISVYTPREIRVTNLAKKIAMSEHLGDKNCSRCQAEELIERDAKEKDDLGQRVSDAFPLGDLFVDTRNRQHLSASLQRFLEIIFSYPFHTPMKDEFFMALAAHASLRSADLSRQVGAVIATKNGEIITLGCNEVPKMGGGMYWPGNPDYRDFQLGYDSGTTAIPANVSEGPHKV